MLLLCSLSCLQLTQCAGIVQVELFPNLVLYHVVVAVVPSLKYVVVHTAVLLGTLVVVLKVSHKDV